MQREPSDLTTSFCSNEFLEKSFSSSMKKSRKISSIGRFSVSVRIFISLIERFDLNDERRFMSDKLIKTEVDSDRELGENFISSSLSERWTRIGKSLVESSSGVAFLEWLCFLTWQTRFTGLRIEVLFVVRLKNRRHNVSALFSRLCLRQIRWEENQLDNDKGAFSFYSFGKR